MVRLDIENSAVLYVVYPNVDLGPGAEIGQFVIIGLPAETEARDELKTCIGSRAKIRSHTVIYAGNSIGDDLKTGHGVMIREMNIIGDDVSIGTNSTVEHHIRIGNRVRIHSNAFIPEYSVLDEGSWVGPNAVFTNASYPGSPSTKANLKGPHLLHGAKIGANATLLPGVVIGRNALVGAGSVVLHDVPDNKVVVGNPARVIKDITELDAYKITEIIQGK